MKKMKKFFAMLLTLAMVMGLSLTAFADGSASIKVKGLVPGETTTLNIYKIVALNTEDSTWKVTNEAYAEFVDLTQDPANVDWTGLKEVLVDGETVTTTAAEYDFTGLDIGLYAITASGVDADGEPSTTYSIMGTNTYNYDANTNLIVARNVTITAKGESYTITKTLATGEESKTFVRKGDTVTFDITMVFPSYGEDTVDQTFSITDNPTGMKIQSVDSVTVGGNVATLTTDYTVTELGVANKAVTVNFTEAFIGTENAHAGQTVVVTLTAVVTDDTTYSNNATSNKAENPSTDVEGNSGSITINKLDESNNSLTGARFTVGENGTVLEFVFVSEANGTAIYTLKTADVDGTAVTELGTDTASTIVVKGLGAGTYEITETKAPEGYSVVEVEDVVLAEGTDATRNISKNVIDTQLSSLPSTGGIGTTIFTIGGCAIMIIAAGLYFSLRRKATK